MSSLYYATIATVIPVLFLAIAVQGTMLDSLTKAAGKLAARRRAQGRYPHEALLLLSMCGLIVLYGGLGEIFALTALLHQHAGQAQEWMSQPGVLFLAVLAGAGPAAVFYKAVRDVATKEDTVTWLGKPKGQPAGQTEEASEPAAANGSDSETDKPDIASGPENQRTHRKR